MQDFYTFYQVIEFLDGAQKAFQPRSSIISNYVFDESGLYNSKRVFQAIAMVQKSSALDQQYLSTVMSLGMHPLSMHKRRKRRKEAADSGRHPPGIDKRQSNPLAYAHKKC